MCGVNELVYEFPENEYDEWKEAMGLSEEDAPKLCEKVLYAMSYPIETFAQASARLGIGDSTKAAVRNWYYKNNILYES